MSPLDDSGGTGRSAIGEMVFACDVNLGFPCDHPEWAAFFYSAIMAGARSITTT